MDAAGTSSAAAALAGFAGVTSRAESNRLLGIGGNDNDSDTIEPKPNPRPSGARLDESPSIARLTADALAHLDIDSEEETDEGEALEDHSLSGFNSD